ncbi:MAG TPA: hypothetical protein VH816_17170 [Gaiellaceae bacterium]
MTAFRRDRAALGWLALAALGALLLLGVLLAILLPGGKKPPHRRAAPSTNTTRPATTTTAPTTTAPPPTTTAPPPTTTAPPPPTTAPPPGPIQAVAVGPFSATVEWTAPDPPPSVAYGVADLGPTMWAPLQGRQATLTGLRYSTAYRVWAGDATLDFETAGVPASPVAAIRDGTIVLDGQPVFPLAVVAQCPSGYGASLAAGISLFAGNDCGGIADQTEGLGGRAFSLTNANEVGIGGPGVIGWYYPDEADLKGLTGDTLPQFPTLAETARLRVLTVTNHFYSRTAPLPTGRGVYPGLIAKADVVGFDLYPLQELCKLGWLPDVAAAQRELVRLAAGRPTFQWIEAQTWKCHQPRLRVTPATVRLESWLSVIGGARGIGFFPADWDPALTPAISAIAHEVAALGGALLAPETSSSASAPVLAAARSLGGALYVIAANPTRRPVRATIEAAGLGGRQLEVLEEGRTIASSGDSFGDAFGPFAVHLYVAKPA